MVIKCFCVYNSIVYHVILLMSRGGLEVILAIDPQSVPMTVEAYLELDRTSPDIRYEYIDGQVAMMSGGTSDHATIGFNLARIIHDILRGSACRMHNSDMRVRLSPSQYVYPDVSVSCDSQDRGRVDVIQSPCFVAEVLSPGTEGYDRGLKSLCYRACPTIQEYMLVSSERAVIEVFKRQKGDLWLLATLRLNDEVQLTCLNRGFLVQEVYEDILFAT